MDKALSQKSNLLGSTLLISGCCIGAGMIGFPVVNALAGFIPSSLAMIICYLFATTSGLLILEATLWFDKKVNLLSIVEFSLGKLAKGITWFLFLFLFYCLFVAYIDGGGEIFRGILSSLFHTKVPGFVGPLMAIFFVGASSYAGARAVAGFSRLFLLGLMICYCAMVSLAISHVSGDQLMQINWKASLATLPILLVSFGYQNLVPTIVYYAKKNVSVIRLAIFVGNLIPFLVYFLWNLIILGILPEQDPTTLKAIVHQSDMITGLLASQSSKILFFAKAFSFFAIFTPFMAITLSFVDFFKDGFKISSESKYDFAIYALVLVPPFILNLLYPRLFLKALGLAGGLADVLLFGVIPALVVWTGRYIRKVDASYKVRGGKLLLVSILMLCIAILFVR